jgi:alanyl-tRNA synthetase
MNTLETREKFISFFRKCGHKYFPQSKIYNDDPTLFFVNSGMCQFKNHILGLTKPTSGNENYVNYQVCIRAGGKHNDFDDVGKDSYHLTCFEMLGFWNLNGLAHKKGAIEIAYRFLTEECGLEKDRLYVTYFAGNETIPSDEETLDSWKEIVSVDKIIKGNFKDNFWMMAENGPCGVCTEIHYDTIGGRDASELVNKDDPTVIEIWNIVFIQYNKIGEEYEALGKLYVDTGMGMERLSMILQKKKSLYTTDVFRPLISYAQILSNAEPYTDTFDKLSPFYINDVSYRIFADHIRTCVIALFQGLNFGCFNREFILRKIFRRMMMHMYLYLYNTIVKPTMNQQVIKALISHILSHFLWFQHDVEDIQKKLVEEEKLYIGKLYNIKTKYLKHTKKSSNIDSVIRKLRETEGIDSMFIPYINTLTFDVGDIMK